MAPRRPKHGKNELLHAALRVFADRGYRGATTAGIAREAGVAQPLVHHHFGSKDGLWQAVVNEAFADMRSALASALQDDTQSAEARVRALLSALIDFLGDRPEISRLIDTESSAGGPPFDHIFDAGLAELTELFRLEFDRAVAAGVFAPMDLDLVYPLVLGVCRQPFTMGLTVSRAFGADVHHADYIARYRALAVEFLLSALAPDQS